MYYNSQFIRSQQTLINLVNKKGIKANFRKCNLSFQNDVKEEIMLIINLITFNTEKPINA